MVDIIQKQDLDLAVFTNNNTLASQGVSIPQWTPARAGIVLKASGPQTIQDAGLGAGNAVAAPAVGTLSDVVGVTPEDVREIVHANYRQNATTFTVPSSLFPTVTSVLNYLMPRYLAEKQVISVVGRVAEPGALPLHAQAHMVTIQGAAASAPLVPADNVFTGWTPATLAADIAATMTNIRAKFASSLLFPASTINTTVGQSFYSMSNLICENYGISMRDNATFYSSDLTILNGRVEVDKNSHATMLNFNSFVTNNFNMTANNNSSINISAGFIKSALSALLLDGASDVVVIGAAQGMDIRTFQTGLFCRDASTLVFKMLANSGSHTVASLTANAITQQSGILMLGVLTGATLTISSEQIAAIVARGVLQKDDNVGGGSLVISGGTAGNSALSVGSSAELQRNTTIISNNAAALTHIEVEAGSLLKVNTPFTFSGVAIDNLAVRQMGRVSLNGVAVPLGANIPLNTATANGAYIAA